MPCAILTCIFAGAAIASARPATDSLVFKRTYADGERLVYHGLMKMSGMDMTLDSIVKVAVRKKTLDAKPQISLVTTKYESTGPNVTPSEKPRDIVITVGANSMPEDLELKKGDSDIYPWLLIGAMTADKAVEVGQEFPESWSSKGDIPMAIKGTGKVTALDSVAKTASVTWTFSVSVGGTDVGKAVLKSVYDAANCRLESCEGTIMDGMCSISIKRQ